MKSILITLLAMLLGWNAAEAQVKSPDAYLGYPIGSRFTPHEQVVAYFKYLANSDKNVQLVSYGKTYEGRELMVAIVSSKENIDNLDQIKKNNVGFSRGTPSAVKSGRQPAILWLSYNVHGNEASCTEAAMTMLFALVEKKAKHLQDWLENTVVIVDPCLNPDGRERYVGFFSQVSGHKPNADPMAREHSEPWPGGRYNHYYFDLNRDWAWQSQVETRQRLKLYQEWMPQVHVDFHEQNYNEPYYFAPAAEPIHEDVTPWQREFQAIAGKNNAKYFDLEGWHYFTKERFDLLYPSYGDTYPLYNGAIGMTYEQGGIDAGLAVVTIDGDTLTLKDRIDHHFMSGLATLETVSNHAGKLVSEFKRYFETAISSPPGIYKAYVVKGDNLSKIKRLAALLDRNGIEYAYGSDKSLRGFSYESRKTEAFKVGRNDLIVSLRQPRAVLANVLFEPQTTVTDSNTYDITAWALPYAYGLPAFATKEPVKGDFPFLEEATLASVVSENPYAWIFRWNSLEDVQLLVALQQQQIKVRIAEEAFVFGKEAFEAGTLLVYRSENERTVKGLSERIMTLQKKYKIAVYAAPTGYVERGKDLGSSVYPVLNIPKVALITGPLTASQNVGEVWHFFEQELDYPLTMIALNELDRLDINKINVLIVPDGSYTDAIGDKLDSWLNNGGKVILFEDAISVNVDKKPFHVKLKAVIKDELKVNALRKYGERNQDDLSNAIPGAIFRVNLDHSHPLAAGLGNYYYALKTDDKIYELLAKDWNIGFLKSNSYMAGVVGKEVLKKLDSGMLFGVQPVGKGAVIYLANNILFRSFWENGKQLFANAVFLVN